MPLQISNAFKYPRKWQSVLIFLRFTHFFSVLKQFSWCISAVVFCGYLQQSTRVLTTLQRPEQHRPESLDLPLRVGYMQHREKVINVLSFYPTPNGMGSRFPSNQLWRVYRAPIHVDFVCTPGQGNSREILSVCMDIDIQC